MAAPCFYTARVLAADLSTLGYERANDSASISHAGRERLETLTWLAHVIDPSFEDASEEGLAAFWDRLGLHSAPKNSVGYCVPLTAAGDKPSERNAAALYLRTAIDLAMAFRRRREMKEGAGSERKDAEVKESESMEGEQEGEGSEGRDAEVRESDSVEGEQIDEGPLLDEEDEQANRQLERLVMERHLLFPSTVKLLDQPQGKKRRPLAQRKPSTFNRGTVQRTVPAKAVVLKKEAKDVAKKPKTREEILERLRSIQREAQDLQRNPGAASVAKEAPNEAEESEPLPELGDEEVRNLADSSEALTKLLAEFKGISIEALAFRSERSDLAKRDAAADEKVSGIAVECRDLEEEVRTMLLTARKLQTSVSKLVHGRCVLENLPNSSAVKGVVQYGRRIEKHM